ncbi:accessory factor UbiK family protein [Candidatus Liberibacter sp.]|uniref:accessory factor UbiK family protein n=1 Tax=Candidatus Liberibacter sp. TaxID=34022 RepID=UPI0015F54611|nr:accessory factor UbiK family protein [Candidatus Liberibacter sp.]MBA5724412.1 accessory factor UbiK family protein [Candidatus Liberibacter sp.]
MPFKPDDVFNQASRLVNCASSTLKDASKEIETFIQVKLQSALNSMDVVRSEDFESVKGMISKARDENAALCKRLNDLEERIANLELSSKKRTK